MKNYWLDRRRKRKVAEIVDAIDNSINMPFLSKRKLLDSIRKLNRKPWPPKKDTKTQP